MTPAGLGRRAARAIDICLDDHTVTLTLRRSSRARRYTLRLTPAGELVLTIPTHGSVERGIAFARAQSRWIRSRLGRLPEHVDFVDGAIVPLRGIPHEIRHAGTCRGVVWAEAGLGDRQLPVLRVAGDPQHLPRRLADWLKREARRDLDIAVRRYATALEVKPGRITVRDPTSRWGSCAASGALSFSWRLILAPAFVLDYLAAHEVTHLVEMNHGARFWRTLKGIAPETDAAEAWLRRHGAGLHRYGPR